MPKGVETGDLTKEEVARIICAHPGDDLTDRSIIGIAGHGSLATVVKHRRALLKEAANLFNSSGLFPSYLVSALCQYGKATAGEEQEKCKNILDEHQKALAISVATISELESEILSMKHTVEQMAENFHTVTAEKISLLNQSAFHEKRHLEISAKAETTKLDLERAMIRLEAAEKTIKEKAKALESEKEELDLHRKAETELGKRVAALESSLASKEELIQHLKQEKQELHETLEALRGKPLHSGQCIQSQ